MDPRLEQKFADLEDRYWWYVGKNRLVREWAGSCGRALDLGCGTGALFEQIARRADSLFGIDLSRVALAHSRRRVPSAGLARASVLDLPFREGSFDTLVASEVLEHLPDDRQALAEWRRVLRPLGRLILTTPAHPHLWGRHDELCHHQRRYRKRELRDRLREAGFRVERVSYTFAFLYPVMAALRPLRRRGSSDTGDDGSGLGDDFFPVPDPMNRLLIALAGLEARWLKRAGLPFGASLIALARRD
ncbi:MAG: class I SAM-dependent methyltransferase [Candidatus Tectomicrobia bacterium]|nr:class I SAM-dependent methyltransferase [Candidatus Tectomicrobia bacterium]